MALCPDPAASPLGALAAPPGLVVVMRGQEDRQPGFSHRAGGRGQARQAKGYAGPEMHTKEASITNSTASIPCQSHHS